MGGKKKIPAQLENLQTYYKSMGAKIRDSSIESFPSDLQFWDPNGGRLKKVSCMLFDI